MIKKSNVTSGELVLLITSSFEKYGIRYVYLRNHEKLPYEIGNDADILVDSCRLHDAISISIRSVRDSGWYYLGCNQHSCHSMYFANEQSSEILHIDLFDRIEWHFMEYAHRESLFNRSIRNHCVMIPSPADEIYLNLITRLIYSGVIREKHVEQAKKLTLEDYDLHLKEAFMTHLGRQGEEIYNCLHNQNWEASRYSRFIALKAMILKYGLLSPLSTFLGLYRYVMRAASKFISPPGKFIVFEGADGSGKSTLLKEIIPWCSAWNGGRPVFDFHWKPLHLNSGNREAKPAVNPRESAPRRKTTSAAYLIYHLIGYWYGWFRFIRPKMVRSHAVVGDRYSYDLFLDPCRFRLNLPDWLLNIATRLTPKPNLVVCLIGDAEVIHKRKPELTTSEITDYQVRTKSLTQNKPKWLLIDANKSIDEVITDTKKSILLHFSS